MPFSAHVAATINKYIRKETMAIFRKRVFLAMIQKAGNVTFNDSGKQMQWPVRYKRSPIQPFGDGDTSTFVRRDKRKAATLGWRSFNIPESINKIDRLMNKGNEAIVSLWANKVKELMDDFKDQLPTMLITIDGDAAGYGKYYHGLESLYTGTTSSAGNLVGTNVKIYAGISTVRGLYGGSLTGSGVWPSAPPSGPEYDFWSPLVVDYTNTGWQASTKTWPNTCLEALRFAIINTERNSDDLSFFLFDKTLYRQFLDSLSEKERIVVTRGNSDSEVIKAGFKAANFDGVDVLWEETVPYGLGYGITLGSGESESIRLRSLQGQLIESVTDYDIETSSDRILADCYGNLQVGNPRSQCKFQALT